MLEISVDQKHNFQAETRGRTVILNQKDYYTDLSKLSESEFHLLLNDRSFRIRILKREAKELKLEINGNCYYLNIKDPYDLLLHQLGMDLEENGSGVKEIKAPMPGLVIKVLVENGEQVSKNSPLLILEAMKMENILKSPAEGKIASIKIKERDAVEKGQVLISFS